MYHRKRRVSMVCLSRAFSRIVIVGFHYCNALVFCTLSKVKSVRVIMLYVHCTHIHVLKFLRQHESLFTVKIVPSPATPLIILVFYRDIMKSYATFFISFGSVWRSTERIQFQSITKNNFYRAKRNTSMSLAAFEIRANFLGLVSAIPVGGVQLDLEEKFCMHQIHFRSSKKTVSNSTQCLLFYR